MWLLDAKTVNRLEAAALSGAAVPSGVVAAQRNAERNGKTAIIPVQGVLTKAPDLFAAFFGGGNTTYAHIQAELVKAERDASVTNIELHVDSPGGTVAGLFDTLAAMQAVTKPIRAVVSDLAASAAYAIVSQADEIVATNRAAAFGSIGIVVTLPTSEDSVTITSSEAPYKRPDPSTDEGVEAIRDELDAMHSLFVEAIAAGRNTEVRAVNENFGRGAVLLADEAKKRGMIDAVQTVSLVSNSATAKRGKNDHQVEKNRMNLDELKAEHAALYAQVVELGEQKERDRVVAHLTMGEASGDMKTATAAIKDGSGMTAALQAAYMAAGMNRADINARQEDDSVVGAAADAVSQENEKREEQQAIDILRFAAAGCGVDLEAK